MNALLVGVGGGVGSMLRYWLSNVVQGAAPASAFPAGTLAVNVLGCLAMGAVSAFADARGILAPETRALLVVGFLGGFTTFSAFAGDTMGAVRAGHGLVASANVLVSVFGCLAAAWAGRALVSMLARW